MIRKTQSHGRIGEAAVSAKCWMNGIPAYNTGGLRSNFAGSDLIVETQDPRAKLWIQVKTGYPTKKGEVYLTQCTGEGDLKDDKFVSDFVIFVNLNSRVASTHDHEGDLDFEHLSFYVVPRDEANQLYRDAVNQEYRRPKRDGGQRKLANMAVQVSTAQMEKYLSAWALIRNAIGNEG